MPYPSIGQRLMVGSTLKFSSLNDGLFIDFNLLQDDRLTNYYQIKETEDEPYMILEDDYAYVFRHVSGFDFSFGIDIEYKLGKKRGSIGNRTTLGLRTSFTNSRIMIQEPKVVLFENSTAVRVNTGGVNYHQLELFGVQPELSLGFSLIEKNKFTLGVSIQYGIRFFIAQHYESGRDDELILRDFEPFTSNPQFLSVQFSPGFSFNQNLLTKRRNWFITFPITVSAYSMPKRSPDFLEGKFRTYERPRAYAAEGFKVREKKDFGVLVYFGIRASFGTKQK